MSSPIDNAAYFHVQLAQKSWTVSNQKGDVQCSIVNIGVYASGRVNSANKGSGEKKNYKGLAIHV